MTSKSLDLTIIIINWNRVDETVRCLESIKKLYVVGIALHVVVVDNGSKIDPTKRIRSAYRGATILRLTSNSGFTGGANAGLRYSHRRGSDWCWLLNNDCRVAPQSLVELMKVASNHQLLSPIIYHQVERSGDERIQFGRGVIDWLRGGGQALSQPITGQSSFLPGTALLIHRSVIEKIGDLDDRYFAYNEDADYCVRATRAGFSLGVARDAKIWHGLATSTGVKSPLFWYLNTRNKWLFMKSHAPVIVWPIFLIHYFFWKPIAFRLLARLIRPSSENRLALAATLSGTFDGIGGHYGQPRGEWL